MKHDYDMELLDLPMSASSLWITDGSRRKTGECRSGRLRMGVVLGVLGMVLIPMGSDLFIHAQSTFPPHRVTVTAYTNVAACTDSTPNETASLMRIKPKHYGKIIALSRDLARHYRFGDRFELWLDGKVHIVEFQDLMAKKHKNRIDLLSPSLRKSVQFGVKQGLLVPLGRSEKG